MVSVIDLTATIPVAQQIAVEGNPSWVAFSPDGSLTYVTLQDWQEVHYGGGDDAAGHRRQFGRHD